jgi:hypothetical protein
LQELSALICRVGDDALIKLDAERSFSLSRVSWNL